MAWVAVKAQERPWESLGGFTGREKFIKRDGMYLCKKYRQKAGEKCPT
jgi:hypothetical protein